MDVPEVSQQVLDRNSAKTAKSYEIGKKLMKVCLQSSYAYEIGKKNLVKVCFQSS